MGFRGLIIIISALFTANAPAFSMPNKPVGCANSQVSQSQLNDFAGISGLIDKVSLSSDDNRGPLTKRGPEIGLTAHDMDHIRKSTGYVHCPGTTNNNGSSLSGTIMGSDDQILTNLHAFIDDNGKIRDPLSECYFMNQDKPYAKRSLQLKDGKEGLDQAMAATRGPKDLGNWDRIAVKMSAPIEGASAYRLRPEQIAGVIHDCTDEAGCLTMVVISAYQLRMPVKVSRSEPVAQTCRVRKVVRASAGEGGVVYNDCSSTPGSSASVNFLKDSNGNLVRGPDGELVPFAIFTSSTDETRDHQPFAITTADGIKPLNVTKSLLLDASAADEVQQMAELEQKPVRRAKAP